ncbi:MAG: putative peptidase [Candidatus Heimdallarchaeota archaeon LC_3]|nr:MAG: putative peptidase [Candidatus Heimdallarchaeota archaeon LC_3]
MFNMNSQSNLLTLDEFKLRINKVQSLLKLNNLDGLIATLEVNFRYLFKSNAHISERLTAVVLPSEGTASLITPAFEKQNMLRDIPLSEENVHTWEETENPYQLLASECARLGLLDGKIALTPNTTYNEYKKIQSNLPKVIFSDGYKIFNDARIVKTESEIKLLEKASEYSTRAIEKVLINDLKEGLTEIEVSNMVAAELTKLSGEPAHFSIVQFSSNTAIPHGMPTEKKLVKNSSVLIDAGTSVQGYNGDITNTTFFGKPSKEFLEVYNLVEEANQVGVESSTVGTPCEEVDQAARKIIESKGYGEYFNHRLGHGIGLEVHEEPYIVNGNKIQLELNHVHSIEPGIYLLNKFGVRIEDDIIVGGKSGIRASNPDRRLWERS